MRPAIGHLLVCIVLGALLASLSGCGTSDSGAKDSVEKKVSIGVTVTAGETAPALNLYRPLTIQWQQVVGPGPLSRFRSVAVDSTGNVYAVGAIGTGTYDFGESVGVTGGYPGFCAVLVKFDSSGAAQWAQTLSDARFSGVAVDSGGTVYAVGEQGTGTYNWATGSFTRSNAVLAKYDSSGTAQPVQTFVSGLHDSRFYAVAVDASGSAYAVGEVGSDIYSSGGSVEATEASTRHDALLVKYDSSGALQWVQGLRRVYDSEFHSVAVDSSGNVYAAGVGYDAVLVKYDSMGTALWTQDVSAGDSRFSALAVDSSGNVYAAGRIGWTQTYNFGGSVEAAGASAGYNVVLAKYDSSGTAQWARTVSGGDDDSQFYSLAVDAGGNVYAAGYIYGTGAYNFSRDIEVKGTSGAYNVLLVKYDSSGTAQWARTVGAEASCSEVQTVTLDGTPNVYLAASIEYAYYNDKDSDIPEPGEAAVLVKYASE